MNEPTEDFDGCNPSCRRKGAHTLEWGLCELAVAPEPTVSMWRSYTAPDGFPAIGADRYTLKELADLIEPALREARIALGPNALKILGEGEAVGLSGGEYAELARLAAYAIIHRNEEV